MDSLKGSSNFPPCLVRMCKFVCANFLSIEHLKVVEVLLSKPYKIFTENEIIESLKIDTKLLRVLANALKNEKIIRVAVKSMPSTNQHQQNFKTNVYHIDFINLINSIRYKLDQIQIKLQKQEQRVIGKTMFACPNCQKEYTDLDISQLFHPLMNTFV